MSVALIEYKPKEPRAVYDKRDVLRFMLLYHKQFAHAAKTGFKLGQLAKARNNYGVQFLLDLYLLSEVYIHHFPKIDIPSLRKDTTTILNSCPRYRLMYE